MNVKTFAIPIAFTLFGMLIAGIIFFAVLPPSHRTHWLRTASGYTASPLTESNNTADILIVHNEQFVDEPTLAIYGTEGIFPIEAEMIRDICASGIFDFENILYENWLEFSLTLTKPAETSFLQYLERTGEGTVVIILDGVKAGTARINQDDLANFKSALRGKAETPHHFGFGFPPNSMHHAAEMFETLYADRPISDCSAINVDVFNHELFKLFEEMRQKWEPSQF